MRYHPSDDAPAAAGRRYLVEQIDPRQDELMASSTRAGLLVDEKERRGLGENHPPGYIKDRPEELIIVGDGVDETADFDKPLVDVQGLTKRLHFRQHASLFASRAGIYCQPDFCVENSDRCA